MTDPVAYLETIQLDLTNLTHLFALPESVWSEGRFTYTMREENGEKRRCARACRTIRTRG